MAAAAVPAPAAAASSSAAIARPPSWRGRSREASRPYASSAIAGNAAQGRPQRAEQPTQESPSAPAAPRTQVRRPPGRCQRRGDPRGQARAPPLPTPAPAPAAPSPPARPALKGAGPSEASAVWGGHTPAPRGRGGAQRPLLLPARLAGHRRAPWVGPGTTWPGTGGGGRDRPPGRLRTRALLQPSQAQHQPGRPSRPPPP